MDVIINRSYRSYRNDQKPKYVMRADGKSILCPLLLLARPAVSFVGSPTISPTTIAACVGFLLPPDSPAHQHNNDQTTAQHQNKIHLRICLSLRSAQTSARGLREFDAAASHPRTTARSCRNRLEIYIVS